MKKTVKLADSGNLFRCEYCSPPGRLTLWHKSRGGSGNEIYYCFEHLSDSERKLKTWHEDLKDGTNT